MTPSPEELASAPFLDDWALHRVHSDAVVLTGDVSGHPGMTDGSMTTSGLVAFNAEAGWARTANRVYRLGGKARHRQRLNEFIASLPDATMPPFDEAAAIAAWEDDPSLPPWRP